MINKELAFDKSNKLVLQIKGPTSIENNYIEIKEIFIKNPSINKVSTASSSIGRNVSTAAIGIGQ